MLNEFPRFIVDINVGKVARLLRMIGYDTVLFDHGDDSRLIHIALREGRIILTRDTQIMKRRVITTGRLQAVLITSDHPEQQMRQVLDSLQLGEHPRSFSLCLECNQPLEERSRDEVTGQVPPYIFQTHDDFVQCPACQRIYWKGTHWQAMTNRLQHLTTTSPEQPRETGDKP
jgi:uncharacterized protein with PIN domain